MKFIRLVNNRRKRLSELPHWGYLFRYEDGITFKYGITSGTVHKRLIQTIHKNSLNLNGKWVCIRYKLFKNRKDVIEWENSMRRDYGGVFGNKDYFVFKDGKSIKNITKKGDKNQKI